MAERASPEQVQRRDLAVSTATVTRAARSGTRSSPRPAPAAPKMIRARTSPRVAAAALASALSAAQPAPARAQDLTVSSEFGNSPFTAGTSATYGTVTIGDRGSGEFIQSAPGITTTVTSETVIAYGAGSIGTLNLSGGSYDSGDDLFVGGSGSGTLNITNGASVSNAGGNIGWGFVSEASGTATVTGSGSSWTNRSALAVGALSRGTLTVANGGQVSSSGDSAVGLFATGTATVTGAGSAWTSIGNLTVGSGRSGTLTLSNGGRMSVGGGGGTVSVATDPTVIGALNIGAAAGQAAVAAGTLLAGTVSFGSGTGTLVFNHTGNPDGSAVTFAPSITGAGSVRQIAGTTLLSGANTYTGGTTVSGGVLNVGRAGALGASANELAVAGGTLDLGGYAVIQNGGLTLTGGEIRNGTLSAGTFDLQTGTVSAVLDGPGRAVKSGAGTVTLSGANTYHGGTAIVAGTLQLGSGIGGGSSGSIAGDVINDGTLAFNRSNALTVAGIISGTGRVAQIGSGRTTLSGSNTYSGGTVIDAGTLSAGADANLGAGSGALAFGGGTLATTASFATARNATLNAGGGTVAPAAGTVLTASGVISGIGSLTVSGGGSLALTGTNTYTGATRISGGTLALSGTGSIGSSSTVALATGGTFSIAGLTSGGTAIRGLSDTAPGQAGAVTLGANTLTLTGADAGFGGVISGTGGLALTGGRLTLSGANTYSGGTALTAGTIQVQSNSALGTGALTFTSGATLQAGAAGLTLTNAVTTAGTSTVDTQANTLTLSGPVGGAGTLTKIGTGTLALTGPNTYTGGTAINAGTVSAGAAVNLGSGGITFGGAGTLATTGTFALGQTVTLGAAGTVDTAAATTLTADRVIAGAGALTKAGSGTLVLTAANTYRGGTAIVAGTLQFGSGAGGGGTGSITGDVANAGTLAFNRSNALSVAGVISGTGAVTQIGAGTTTLSGVNTYSGSTTIDAGILQVAADANLGASTGALTFGGGTLATTASFATARTATLNAGGGTVAPAAGTVLTASGTISGTGPLTVGGPGTLVLAGANTYTGATTINAGATLQLGAGAAAGSIDATAGITNNGALVADRSDTLTLAAPISGSGTLTQAGPGTTILTARSTYTGATTVNAGVLQIDGVLTASDVTVNRGGTLSGSGKIGDPLINAGGTLAPGSASSIGTLSITGPLTFAPGSFYTVKITPSANDRTTVTGTATLNGGTVQVLAGSGTYTPALRYTLLSATGGVTGTFSNLQTTSNLAFLTPSLSYDRNAVYLGFAQTAALTTVAATPNQIGPAAALNGVAPTVTTTVTTTDAGTTTRTEISNVTPAAQVATAVLNQTAPGAVQALNALSGEVQASAISAITQTAFVVREAILDHLRFGEGNGFAGAGLGGPGLTGAIGQRLAPGTTLPAAYAADVAGGPEVGLVPVRPVPPGYGVWGQAFGAFGDAGDRNAARLTRQVGGFVLGAETGAGVPGGASGDWRAGLAAGYTFTALDITARQSTGQVESGFGAVYARGPLGLVQVRLGTAYAGDALDTRRAVLFPGFSQSVSGKTGGDTVQGFGEVGYRIGFAAGYVEPFVGGATVHIRRDGFAETGGAAALTVYGRSYDVRTATIGVQGQAVVADLFGGAGPLVARGLVGYRRAFGDVVPQALLAFAGGGQAFLTAGVPVARDAVVASAGLDWQVAERTTVGLSYNGQIGSMAQDHAVKGSFSYRW